MKKKRIIIFTILLLLVIGIVIFLINKVSMNKNYIIHYKNSLNQYEITATSKEITIKIEEQVQCIQAPCDPVIRYETVKYNKKYKQLIEKLFKDTSKKEITITNTDLNNEELKILYQLLGQR